MRVASSSDNNTYTEYDVLPAAHQLPTNEVSRELAAALANAEDWISARYELPSVTTDTIRSATLVVAKTFYTENRTASAAPSEDLAEQRQRNMSYAMTLLAPQKKALLT